MSDTTKIILLVVLSLLVLAGIIWYFLASARRHEQEAHRMEAAADLRAQGEERLPDGQDVADRAGPEQVAADTPAEAEAQAGQAGGSVGDGAAARGAGALAGGSLGGAAVFGRDEDEPDLADAEDPFARPSTGSPDEPDEPADSDVSAEPAAAETSATEAAPPAASEEPTETDSGDPWAPSDSGTTRDDTREEALDERADERADFGADERADDNLEENVKDNVDETADDTVGVGSTGDAAGVESTERDWTPSTSPDEDEGTTESGPRADDTSVSSEDSVDWVNDPVDEDAEVTPTDAEATDWINGPAADDSAASRDAAESSDGAEPKTAEPSDVAEPEAVPVDPMDLDVVAVPALDDIGDVVTDGGTPSGDPGDHRGQPWSTAFGDPAVSGEVDDGTSADAAPDVPAADPSGAEPGPVQRDDDAPRLDDDSGTDEGGSGDEPISDSDPRSERDGETAETGSERAPESGTEAGAETAPESETGAAGAETAAESETGAAGAETAPESETEPPAEESAPESEPQPQSHPEAEESASGGSAERRISAFDEVVDGGYGIGSAAPIQDGAQPLGHAVKGWLDTMTFVSPEGRGYQDAEPDVWFFNEEAARRAGFNPGGE